MVIGEIAINIAKQLDHLATQAAIQIPGNCTGNAIAAIDRELHRFHQLDVADDAR